MDLISVTPYIRFANYLHFEVPRGPSKTYDCRLIYTAGGFGEMHISGETYSMTPGSVSIFQANTHYYFEPAPALDLIVLDFDYTQDWSSTESYLVPCPVASYLPDLAHGNIQFSDAPMLNAPLFLENAAFMEVGLQKIVVEFQEKRLFYRGMASTLFKSVLFELVRFSCLGSEQSTLVKQIMDYISKNLSDPVSNIQIGTHFNYSPNYLNRLMQRHTGKTLHQYVLQQRINTALKLIQTTNMTIAEIALRLGFNSPSHFSYCFRNETGFTPTQLRGK